MNIDRIFICPGDSGYEFSESEKKVNARLLMLLRPTSIELRQEESIVPVLRADWLEEGWWTPKTTVLAMVGLRAALPSLSFQRGSNSIWAVATVFSVVKTPTSSSIRSTLPSLVDDLKLALKSSLEANGFTNTAHQALVSLASAQDLESAINRLKQKAESGSIPGPFFKSQLLDDE